MGTIKLSSSQEKFLELVYAVTDRATLPKSNPDKQHIVEVTHEIIRHKIERFMPESAAWFSKEQQRDRTITMLRSLFRTAQWYRKHFDDVTKKVSDYLNTAGTAIKPTLLAELLDTYAPFLSEESLKLTPNHVSLLKVTVLAHREYVSRCRKKQSNEDYDLCEEPDLEELEWMLALHCQSVIMCNYFKHLAKAPPLTLSDSMVKHGLREIQNVAASLLLQGFNITIAENVTILNLTKEEILEDGEESMIRENVG